MLRHIVNIAPARPFTHANPFVLTQGHGNIVGLTVNGGTTVGEFKYRVGAALNLCPGTLQFERYCVKHGLGTLPCSCFHLTTATRDFGLLNLRGSSDFTLSSYGIRTACFMCAKGTAGMRIFVKVSLECCTMHYASTACLSFPLRHPSVLTQNLAGDSATLRVSLDDSIEWVKMMIGIIWGVKPEQIWVCYARRQLERGTLKDYGIQRESVLIVGAGSGAGTGAGAGEGEDRDIGPAWRNQEIHFELDGSYTIPESPNVKLVLKVSLRLSVPRHCAASITHVVCPLLSSLPLRTALFPLAAVPYRLIPFVWQVCEL